MMIPGADSAITRNEKSLIVAYDHGLEHGPVDFEPNPATADPDRVFEIGNRCIIVYLRAHTCAIALLV